MSITQKPSIQASVSTSQPVRLTVQHLRDRIALYEQAWKKRDKPGGISVWIIEHKKKDDLHPEDSGEKSPTVTVWLQQ